MTPRKTIAGLSATAIIMGGVDASVLNETPIERVEMIANERVETRQIDNVVETTLPWRGEEGLKIKYDMGEPTILERFNDKRKQEVITETVNFGDGGFKVDILLNERPDTNRFCYAIEGAENYDFFYQPPLTEQEIVDGAYRPDDIVGSYAVYHKELKNHVVGRENYATGKVMHIPRPQVWELDNPASTTIWADLSYSERDGLCVTVDQNYLDNANYPVRVDPTFGYTGVGASYGIGSYSLTTFFATTTASGTLQSVSYILTAAGFGNTDPAAQTRVGVYYATSSTVIGALASGSSIQENNITSSTTVWFTQNLSSPVWFEEDEYFQIGVLYETPGENYVPYDAAAGQSSTIENPYVAGAPTLPNPFPSASFTANRPSIYATYSLPDVKGSQVYINKGTVKVDGGKVIID